MPRSPFRGHLEFFGVLFKSIFFWSGQTPNHQNQTRILLHIPALAPSVKDFILGSIHSTIKCSQNKSSAMSLPILEGRICKLGIGPLPQPPKKRPTTKPSLFPRHFIKSRRGKYVFFFQCIASDTNLAIFNSDTPTSIHFFSK